MAAATAPPLDAASHISAAAAGTASASVAATTARFTWRESAEPAARVNAALTTDRLRDHVSE